MCLTHGSAVLFSTCHASFAEFLEMKVAGEHTPSCRYVGALDSQPLHTPILPYGLPLLLKGSRAAVLRCCVAAVLQGLRAGLLGGMAAGLHGSRVLRLSACGAAGSARLQGHRAAGLQVCRAARVLAGRAARLQDCRVVVL